MSYIAIVDGDVYGAFPSITHAMGWLADALGEDGSAHRVDIVILRPGRRPQ